jgi:hypothetical protein
MLGRFASQEANDLGTAAYPASSNSVLYLPRCLNGIGLNWCHAPMTSGGLS